MFKNDKLSKQTFLVQKHPDSTLKKFKNLKYVLYNEIRKVKSEIFGYSKCNRHL